METEAHPDKVSLAFKVENRPGSLVEALQVFAGMGTNMTRLESRPVPGRPWEYVFYADYQLGEPRTADLALEMLGKHCSMVRELGRYRAAAGGLRHDERGWGRATGHEAGGISPPTGVRR